MKNKLVLIDGNSILYRSFYAIPALMLPDGRYTNAIYGFANMIIKIMTDIKPSHIAVAFDVSKKTFRNDIYADYKATRKPMPDELRSQIEPVKNLLRLMNITILEKEGIEADDILGTISKRFDDTEVIIVTGDRDTLQLISSSTTIYFTKKGVSDIKVMDLAALEEEYGISPSSIIDLKALQGDTADNIPGVYGIGPKTALELIQKYETIDGVYNNLDDIKPSSRNKLIAGKELAYISYQLGKINNNVDISCEIEELNYDFPFSSAVYDFMVEYKFNSIIKREDIFVKEQIADSKFSVESIRVDNNQILNDMMHSIQSQGIFSFFVDENNNMFLSSSHTEWVIPAACDMFSFIGQKDLTMASLKSLFENSKIRKVFFDSKSARHFLNRNGILVDGKFEDISIMVHLVQGVSIKSIEDCLDKPEYNIKNPAISLLKAYQFYLKELESMNMVDLYYNVEIPLSVVLFDMELTGFKVDENRLNELGEAYKAEINQLTQQIYFLAQTTFNINSAKQLGEILYDKLGLPHNKKKSTAVEVLQELANAHPIIPYILRYRKINKLNSTYIEGIKQHIDANSLVHTSFKQTLTTTGRLSSVEPNLQNIPIRSQESREVRSIYIASSKDHILIDADYSQIELRLLAHLSGDPFFIDAFNSSSDIHAQTACQVFGVSADNVTSEMRRIAKVVNFGVIYGISDYGLATDLKISTKEAKNFIESFYKEHPMVREYMNNSIKIAEETGRVSTILGRTRRMLDINSSNFMVRSRAQRASQNMPLQGSAADIIKLAMLKVYNALKDNGLKAKLIMQVHDELIIDCPLSEKEQVISLVKECMNSAFELKVPLVCDISHSYRWSDGH